MGKKLVIVESPAKARTLSRYLGGDFHVQASMGHLIDLPGKTLGVDLEKDFKPSYVVIPGKGKIVSQLKRAAEKAEDVYLAPDPDREGEAIAWHLAGKLGKSEDRVHRVMFNEITKKAVMEAMENPTRLNSNLFEAQQARRILDRLVGYQISPLLWKVVRSGLSAGRVQSVAVRIVCEREVEIRNYLKKEYWSITADLLTQSSEPLSAKLWTVSGLKVVTRPDTEGDRKDRYWIKDSEEAERIAGELSDESVYKVARVEKKEKKRNPQPPFITSTMQREAAVRFGWPARKTMQVAQSLYEGVELGAEGATGLITYMRTDSTRLADSAVAEARKLILADYGERFLPKKPKSYTTKKGKIQDAHEAIRPTSAYRRPDKMKPFLNSDQARLYRLIWSRFVACQMTAAVYDQTTVDIAAGDGGSYILRVTGSVMRFTGFTAVYIENLEKETSANGERNGEDNLLPELEKGDILNLVKISPRQHFTQPPPRFTESSLIRELEANGIGRPSTYASIMSTILDKGYVQRLKGALKPTDLGFAVNGLLVERFPSILNVKFTARMESMLDHVEEGRQDWLKILEEFYGDFKPLLENALSQRKKVTVETDVVCDKCGAKMAIRWSRHGEFLGCSAYPECKNIKQFERDDEGRIKITGQEVTEHKCSKCGSPMVRKNGRYGPFLSCSRYPECKEIKPLSTGIPCPKKGCDGEITEKKTKRGKTFYSCTRYPECDFASWDRPLDYSCTNCGARPVYEKSSRAGGKYIQCKECRTRLKEEDLAREAEGSQGS